MKPEARDGDGQDGVNGEQALDSQKSKTSSKEKEGGSAEGDSNTVSDSQQQDLDGEQVDDGQPLLEDGRQDGDANGAEMNLADPSSQVEGGQVA